MTLGHHVLALYHDEMPRRTLEDCFRTLGLPRSAGAAEVLVAFRRLAREHHPDINPAPDGPARFIEIVESYRVLREFYRYAGPEDDWGPCPRCGQLTVLFDATGGGAACADCLLGVRRARRYLPAPLITAARHLTVVALYAVGIGCFVAFTQTRAPLYLGYSLAGTLGGLALLMVEVLLIAPGESAAASTRIKTLRRGERRSD